MRNKNIYSAFARGYDTVMRDVNYELWANYILDLLQKFKSPGRNWLNCACGTGSCESFWQQAGYHLTGIDQSAAMIAAAREKYPSAKMRFEVMDMTELRLEESFDVVTCLYDSLNYLTTAEDVQAFIGGVASHLSDQGLFIFDVATEANILENFSQVTYAENFPDFAYIWENQYNLETKICRSDFHFFYQTGETGFERESETHFQRMYASSELARWLRQAGLEFLAAYDGFSHDPPGDECDRIHILARKPGAEKQAGR